MTPACQTCWVLRSNCHGFLDSMYFKMKCFKAKQAPEQMKNDFMLHFELRGGGYLTGSGTATCGIKMRILVFKYTENCVEFGWRAGSCLDVLTWPDVAVL